MSPEKKKRIKSLITHLWSLGDDASPEERDDTYNAIVRLIESNSL